MAGLMVLRKMFLLRAQLKGQGIDGGDDEDDDDVPL